MRLLTDKPQTRDGMKTRDRTARHYLLSQVESNGKGMVTIDFNEDYLKQKLEWVAQRMAALEEIEAKLQEMQSLAAYARDNYIDREVAREFNARLHLLQQEITALDEQTRAEQGSNLVSQRNIPAS